MLLQEGAQKWVSAGAVTGLYPPSPAQAAPPQAPPVSTLAPLAARIVEAISSEEDESEGKGGSLTGLIDDVASEDEAPEAADEGGQVYVPHFDSRGDLKKDWEDVRRVLGWVTLVLSCPTLATLATAIGNQPRAGMTDFEMVLDIFVRSFVL